jgi:hypothetical protein
LEPFFHEGKERFPLFDIGKESGYKKEQGNVICIEKGVQLPGILPEMAKINYENTKELQCIYPVDTLVKGGIPVHLRSSFLQPALRVSAVLSPYKTPTTVFFGMYHSMYGYGGKLPKQRQFFESSRAN